MFRKQKHLSYLTAGCTDTDLPAGRRYFGQSDKPLIGTAHVYHAMWVMFTETRCRVGPIGPEIPRVDFALTTGLRYDRGGYGRGEHRERSRRGCGDGREGVGGGRC